MFVFLNFKKKKELCAKKKLKTLLDAPVSRLPHYLQNMAGVYKSCENEGTKDSDAAKDLLKAIVDIKKMTDEISTKCRDQKCRRLVGQLQKDVFNDKILLTAAHRLCVRHGTLKIIKNKQWQPHVFILCNDILVIGTVSSRWKNGEMVAVFPLIGLRILRNPLIEEALQEEGKFRFAVIPQNKNFTPNDSLAMGSVIICCEYDTEMEAWIDEMEDTVDEEEHNLRPCNPVDLEKRLRREPTSPEGTAPTITITDHDKIAEIEEWKKVRETKGRNKVKTKPPPKPSSSSSSSQAQSDGTTEHSDQQTDTTTTATTVLSRSSVSKMAPPPPRSSASSAGPLPTAPAPPPASKRMSTVSPASPPVPPPRRPGRAPIPPNRNGPPPLPSQQSFTDVTSPRTTESSTTPSTTTTTTKPPSTTTTTSNSTTTVPRVNLLGQIASFNRDSTLKKVVKEEQSSTSESHSDGAPQDVASLLQATLANYRTYVQDESDHEESDDEEWDD
ncbi:hypothetical protein RFI_01661 [Reticulomyxa filosa]|uniref:PH domain-containing protein n=1 Tax=Reticulomyxa filosa TaxID=46433 RepID=X6PCN2_RETFI|nr:hypothetical protein RFI_01661 [Reticulomyxa filosa]|eukprot:ETO35402.1 hypothetical protein RFI_01661 [Reticulomyxa filosa]